MGVAEALETERAPFLLFPLAQKDNKLKAYLHIIEDKPVYPVWLWPDPVRRVRSKAVAPLPLYGNRFWLAVSLLSVLVLKLSALVFRLSMTPTTWCCPCPPSSTATTPRSH